MIEPGIIYENDEVLVLNKPAGLTVHAGPLATGPFLTDWLLRYCPGMAAVGESKDRPGLVHRLDRDTSGVIIVAKTPTAFQWLKNEFQNRQVKKTYLALLVGEMNQAVGEEKIINWPIGRSSKDPRIRVASQKAYGRLRPAETRWRIFEHLPDFTLIEAEPLTGRTHQLRAHFKAYQHPVACDELYGAGNFCPPGLARQALHAARLEITLPDGSRPVFAAPLPADLTVALDHLRRSC